MNGTTNPLTTTGVDGDFYINTATNQIFGPKAGGIWGAGVSLIGPAGGPPGLKSLIDLVNFPANATCPSGGITVKSGIDQNSNNVLDANEVDNSKDICFTQIASLDKMIVLPLTEIGVGTSGDIGPIVLQTIINFNKNNYPGVDSIILVANPGVGKTTNTGTLLLYNLTDNVPIANSTILTNQIVGFNPPFRESANIYSSLPAHNIILGISVQSSISNAGFQSGRCYLYLYRK